MKPKRYGLWLGFGDVPNMNLFGPDRHTWDAEHAINNKNHTNYKFYYLSSPPIHNLSFPELVEFIAWRKLNHPSTKRKTTNHETTKRKSHAHNPNHRDVCSTQDRQTSDPGN